MDDQNRFLEASRTLAAALFALAAAGCGGTKLLKEVEPMPTMPPIAQARDGRLEAKVEAVIVRNGPGSWARDASWDEYLILVRNASDAPVQVTGFAIHDSLGARLDPRGERADLVDASAETEKRYQDLGLTVQAGSGSPWLVAAGVGGGTLAFAAGMGSAAAASGGMVGALAAGAVVVSTLAVGGISLATYGIVRALNHREVNKEIQRRQALGAPTLGARAQTSFHVFFPYAPSPSRIAVAYRQDSVDRVLEMDTTAPLASLHLGATPAGLVAPPPPRVEPTNLQRHLAGVIDRGQGALHYLHREPAASAPREVGLVSSVDRRQSFSDGSEYRELREVVAFGDLAFRPPLPLAVPGMQVGRRWSHSGRVVHRALVAEATIDSDLRVEALEDRDTPAGRFASWRVSERRTIKGSTYRLTHWIDVESSALVASRASTDVLESRARSSHGYFAAPHYDYVLELGPAR